MAVRTRTRAERIAAVRCFKTKRQAGS